MSNLAVNDKLKMVQDPHTRNQGVRNAFFVDIGPDEAERILSECAFPGQRKINLAHIQLLVSSMKTGSWLDNDQLTFCRLPSGELYLVNGYHRMNAVVAYGGSIPFSTRVLTAGNMDEVRQAYATFDTMTRKRTEGEVLDAMDIPRKHGLSKAVATAVYQAAPLVAAGLRWYSYQTIPEKKRNVTVRLSTAKDYWEAGRYYQDMLKGASGAHKRQMLRGAVAAVALVTIRECFEQAFEFWPAVANMENLSASDPRLTLAKALDTRKYPNSYPDGTFAIPTQDCAVAWNAFCEGRDLTVLRSLSKFRLKGIY